MLSKSGKINVDICQTYIGQVFTRLARLLMMMMMAGVTCIFSRVYGRSYAHLSPFAPHQPPLAALVFHNFGVRFLSCCGRLIKINEVRRLFILLPDRMYKACPMPCQASTIGTRC